MRTPPIPCALPKKKLSEAPKSVDESHEIATETERAAEEEALRREAHFECAVARLEGVSKGESQLLPTVLRCFAIVHSMVRLRLLQRVLLHQNGVPNTQISFHVARLEGVIPNHVYNTNNASSQIHHPST